MKTRSAKAKGKRLEKWVRDILLAEHPELTAEDIRVPIGAETGEDIKFSKKAIEYFGGKMSIECKNREIFSTIYKFFDQANSKDGTPILIIKMNGRSPLAIVDGETFLKGGPDANREFRPSNNTEG